MSAFAFDMLMILIRHVDVIFIDTLLRRHADILLYAERYALFMRSMRKEAGRQACAL